ncbi:MAG: 1-acyl-sn-glycerol-3-phosphate acyltransferase [Planctomycetes bacterium]|nr:1-acyl-sn-glycerol-3-phosphate acyltransferase [Planctomycetota bacterium]
MLYVLLRLPARLASLLAFGLRADGWRRLPREGGCLVAANHASFLDPVVLGCAARRRLDSMARDSLFAWRPFGWVLRGVGCFPVRRGEGDTTAIREAVRRLQEGRALVVYPEGTRSADGSLGPLRLGVALLASRAHVPVVPAWIEGSRLAYPRGRLLPRPWPVRVRFGPALRYDEGVDDRESFTARLREALVALRGDPAGMRPAGTTTQLKKTDHAIQREPEEVRL